MQLSRYKGFALHPFFVLPGCAYARLYERYFRWLAQDSSNPENDTEDIKRNRHSNLAVLLAVFPACLL